MQEFLLSNKAVSTIGKLHKFITRFKLCLLLFAEVSAGKEKNGSVSSRDLARFPLFNIQFFIILLLVFISEESFVKDLSRENLVILNVCSEIWCEISYHNSNRLAVTQTVDILVSHFVEKLLLGLLPIVT